MNLSLKKILFEKFIPYDKDQQIKAGIAKKYGTEELNSYKFGIELEFMPSYDDADVDERKIEMALLNDMSFIRFAEQRVDELRNDVNRRWRGDIDRWDDSYGPIDPDEWMSHNPEPDADDFETEDEYNESLDKWKSTLSDLEYYFKKFDRNDYFDGIIRDVIRSGEWTEYVSYEDVVSGRDSTAEIKEAIEFISRRMGQQVVYGDGSSETNWAVGEDGSNIEIRSKHLNQSEFNLVNYICGYVSDKETSGGTSAHVHIGLPEDFDAFDVLAITTLVDEKSIENQVGPERELSTWAKFRHSLHFSLIRLILLNQKSKSDGGFDGFKKEFSISNSDLSKKIYPYINRYHGTNVASVSKLKTIEFRYLSSDICSHPNTLINWIKYFLLLPKVAKSRNKVVLKLSDFQLDDLTIDGLKIKDKDFTTLTCIRESGKVKFVFGDGRRVSVSDETPLSIKTPKEPETATLKDKLKRKFAPPA